ncbi:polysaccharide biosynthesis protein [Clostridiales bacterium oral taxon 876 str. F0540]|nr:polysaccharide biosynthesis protein [Clostridiales bacterium oral taxon 876 str. F0540]
MVITINKVIKNFLSISFANLTSQVLTFLVVAYYARILGTDIFGHISTVQAIMMYFTMFVMLGLQTFGTREVSKDEDNIKSIVGKIIFLRTVAFFASYILIVIFYFVNKGNSIFNNLLLIYGITLLPAAFNLDWVFSGLQEMQYNAVYNLIKNLIPCFLIFIFFKTEKQLFLIPLFTLLGLFFALIYQIYVFFRKRKFKISISINKEEIRKYIFYGLPFMFSGVLAMINCNVDRIVIEFTRSSGEAGIYSAGYNIIMFLTNIITLIFTPMFPLLIKYFHEKEFSRLNSVINNLTKIISFIALPIFAGGVILSKDIILLLFGYKYESGYISFAILMIYILILFIREIYGYCLNAWNLEKTYLKIVFISSMINLVFNLIFTPIYGMNIAAFITVISEIINLLLMKKYTENILKIKVFTYFIKTLIPTIVMSFVIIIIKNLNLSVLINILFAVLVYFAAAIIFRTISLKEVKLLFSKEGTI